MLTQYHALIPNSHRSWLLYNGWYKNDWYYCESWLLSHCSDNYWCCRCILMVLASHWGLHRPEQNIGWSQFDHLHHRLFGCRVVQMVGRINRLWRVRWKLCLHLKLHYPKIHNFQIIQYLLYTMQQKIEELNKKLRRCDTITLFQICFKYVDLKIIIDQVDARTKLEGGPTGNKGHGPS
jgi:hypothetical protein